MMPNNNNQARGELIRRNVQRLLNDLLQSAEVFTESDDVSAEEYRELIQIFIPKLRHSLVLVEQLRESLSPEPPGV